MEGSGSGQTFVGGRGQKLGKRVSVGQLTEHHDCFADASLARKAALRKSRRRAAQDLIEQGESNRVAVIKAQTFVMQPLPKLRTRNLGSRGILHQVMNRHAAKTIEPGSEIAHADIDVVLETRGADGAGRRAEKIKRIDLYILAQAIQLVGAGHNLVEFLKGNRDQARMGNPCAIVAVGGFALLVGEDAGERGFSRTSAL